MERGEGFEDLRRCIGSVAQMVLSSGNGRDMQSICRKTQKLDGRKRVFIARDSRSHLSQRRELVERREEESLGFYVRNGYRMVQSGRKSECRDNMDTCQDITPSHV